MATTTRYTERMTHEEAERDMQPLNGGHRDYVAQEERDLRAVMRDGHPPGGASFGKTAWAAGRVERREVIGRGVFPRLHLRRDGSVWVKA